MAAAPPTAARLPCARSSSACPLSRSPTCPRTSPTSSGCTPEGLDPEFVSLAGDLAVAGLLTNELNYVAYAGPVMAAIAHGAPLRMFHYQTVRMQHVLITDPNHPASPS